MDDDTNVIPFPRAGSNGTAEALLSALGRMEAATELSHRVIAKAPDDAMALAAARRVLDAVPSLLNPDWRIDPEHAAAVIAMITKAAAERHGEEVGRTVASRLQAWIT